MEQVYESVMCYEKTFKMLNDQWPILKRMLKSFLAVPLSLGLLWRTCWDLRDQSYSYIIAEDMMHLNGRVSRIYKRWAYQILSYIMTSVSVSICKCKVNCLNVNMLVKWIINHRLYKELYNIYTRVDLM